MDQGKQKKGKSTKKKAVISSSFEQDEEFKPQSSLLLDKFLKPKPQVVSSDFSDLINEKIQITKEQITQQMNREDSELPGTELSRKQSNSYFKDEHPQKQDGRKKKFGTQKFEFFVPAQNDPGLYEAEDELRKLENELMEGQIVDENILEPNKLPKLVNKAPQKSLLECLNDGEMVYLQFPCREIYNLHEGVKAKDRITIPNAKRLNENQFILERMMEKKVDYSYGDYITKFYANIDNFAENHQNLPEGTQYKMGKMRFYSDGTSEFVTQAQVEQENLQISNEENVFQVQPGIAANCYQEIGCIDTTASISDKKSYYNLGPVQNKFVLVPNLADLYVDDELQI